MTGNTPRISLYISLTEYFDEYQLTLNDAAAIPFDMRFFPVFRTLGPKNPGRLTSTSGTRRNYWIFDD